MDALALARMIAKDHGLFIIDVTDRVAHAGVISWRRSHVVYRKLADGRRVRLGKRKDPSALLRFVKQCAGLTEPAHA